MTAIKTGSSRAMFALVLTFGFAGARAPLLLPNKSSGPARSRGETKSFEVGFLNRGLLEGTRNVKLDPVAGVTMNGRALELGVINFLPSRAL